LDEYGIAGVCGDYKSTDSLPGSLSASRLDRRETSRLRRRNSPLLERHAMQ
jgi:hypothetical protein